MLGRIHKTSHEDLTIVYTTGVPYHERDLGVFHLFVSLNAPLP